MFDALLARFPITGRAEGLLPGLGGVTLDDGFYRFHGEASARRSEQACAALIGGFEGRFRCFAVDWLGRELAVDTRPGRRQEVIIVDPGAAEYLTTSTVLDDWHDAVADPEADPLAWTFYQEWRAANPSFRDLAFDQAIGYRVPLFLGGEDEVANLEVTDREVYFEVCTQLALARQVNQPRHRT